MLIDSSHLRQIRGPGIMPVAIAAAIMSHKSPSRTITITLRMPSVVYTSMANNNRNNRLDSETSGL